MGCYCTRLHPHPRHVRVLYRDANRASLPEIEYCQVGGKGGEMILRSVSSCEGAPNLLWDAGQARTPPNSSRSLSTRSVPQGIGVALWNRESAWNGASRKGVVLHEQTVEFCPNISCIAPGPQVRS